MTLYGHYFHCLETHGTLSLHRGIVESCDSYFYTIGNKAGIDNLAFYGNMAGFGQLTGIDLPHEKAGIMPSSEWKLRTQRTKWYAGETPSVAIGQGALTVTPLQLARAIGGLAIGGTWHHPHLKKDLDKPDMPVEWNLNPQNVKDIIDGMYGVVNEGGTGGRARLPNIEVCGKTGSAQLASNDYVKAAGRPKPKICKDNAWFEGFAPRANPEIVVVALFEHGYRGQFAAPIVRDVLKAYFDKKTRLAAFQQNGVAHGRHGQPRSSGCRHGQPAGSRAQDARPGGWRHYGNPSRSPAAAGPAPTGSLAMRQFSLRDIDWPLLLITLVISGVGVLQIYSATYGTDYHGAWWKQIFYVLGGLFLMWLIMAVDYHALMHYVPMLFIASVVALLGTYVIGESAFGSRRWIPMGGGLHLQVSEFVKLVIILLCSPLSDRIEDGRVGDSGDGDFDVCWWWCPRFWFSSSRTWERR